MIPFLLTLEFILPPSIYPTGSVVLYGLNVNRHRVTIELPGNYTIHEYVLTPNNGHLTDRYE